LRPFSIPQYTYAQKLSFYHNIYSNYQNRRRERPTKIEITAILYKLYPEDFYILGFTIVALWTLKPGYFGGKIEA